MSTGVIMVGSLVMWPYAVSLAFSYRRVSEKRAIGLFVFLAILVLGALAMNTVIIALVAVDPSMLGATVAQAVLYIVAARALLRNVESD